MGIGRPRGRHGCLLAGALFTTLGLTAASAPLATAADTEVSASLERHLRQAAPDADVPVIVTLADQVDAERFEGRPGALILALRRAAARGRDDLDPSLGRARRFWLVNAHALSVTPDEVEALRDDPDVARVDLDPPIRSADLNANVITDPTPGAGNWGLSAAGILRARSNSGATGRGVVVGSIDTGVDARHPQLAGRITAFRDFVNGQQAPYDDNGHGTHTVGTMIAADAGGVPVGAAPAATAVVAKAMNSRGVGSGSDLLAAAQWMTDPDGDPSTHDQPDVINNSWTANGPDDPWFRSMIQRWTELGIVPVFAVGNTGPGESSIGSPASYPEAIAVGAIDPAGTVASFSARGPVAWSEGGGLGPASGDRPQKPDLVAPGTSITSTGPGGFLTYTGTSMASPHVAGVVALMRERSPGLAPSAVADILRATARDLGSPGHDTSSGAGALDAAAALAALSGSSPDTAIVYSPRGATRSKTVTLGVTSGSAGSARHRVNGGPWSAPQALPVLRVPLADEGEHTVEVQAVSPDGVPDPTPASVAVTLDRTPPDVRIGWRRRGDKATFVVRASDELTSVARPRWTFGRGVRRAGRRVAVRFTEPGRRVVTVTVRDAAGNRTRVKRRFTPTVTTPVRGLRVRTTPGALRLSGRLARAAGLRATIRPIAPVSTRAGVVSPTSRQGAGTARASRPAARRGRFALDLPTRRLAPGRYRVTLRTVERRRKGAPITRVIDITAP